MSNLDEMKRLENDLKINEELRKKLGKVMTRIQEEAIVKSDGELMVKAAKELGYDISMAALEQASADAEQLDPAELEAVAGGDFIHEKDADGHDDWCWVTWHCVAALRHTNSASDYHVACWSDYLCIMINEKPDIPLPNNDKDNWT